MSVSDTFNGRGWTHITCTFDKTLSSNRLKMYIDGVEESAVNAYAEDILAGDDGIRIGTLTTGYVTAQIASTGFYNTAKSASEILSIYNEGLTGDESSNSGIIGYWKLDTASTDAGAVIDLSTNSNHGQNQGDPTLNSGNNGTPSGSPESIVVREGLNSNKDGLGFPFRNDD